MAMAMAGGMASIARHKGIISVFSFVGKFAEIGVLLFLLQCWNDVQYCRFLNFALILKEAGDLNNK